MKISIQTINDNKPDNPIFCDFILIEGEYIYPIKDGKVAKELGAIHVLDFDRAIITNKNKYKL